MSKALQDNQPLFAFGCSKPTRNFLINICPVISTIGKQICFHSQGARNRWAVRFVFVQYFNITRFIDELESFQWDAMNSHEREECVVLWQWGWAEQSWTEWNSTGCWNWKCWKSFNLLRMYYLPPTEFPRLKRLQKLKKREKNQKRRNPPTQYFCF